MNKNDSWVFSSWFRLWIKLSNGEFKDKVLRGKELEDYLKKMEEEQED